MGIEEHVIETYENYKQQKKIITENESIIMLFKRILIFTGYVLIVLTALICLQEFCVYSFFVWIMCISGFCIYDSFAFNLIDKMRNDKGFQDFINRKDNT